MSRINLWLDVEETDNTLIGEGPVINITSFTMHRRLSRAGEWSAMVPATDPRVVDLLTAQRSVQCYSMIEGERVWRGGGTIDKRIARIAGDQRMLEVSGVDLLGELSRKIVGELELSGDGDTSISTFLALQPTGWSNSITGSTIDFTARFVEESFLNAMIVLADELDAFFRLEEDSGDFRHFRWRTTPYVTPVVRCEMNAQPDAIDSNPLICLITDLQQTEESYEIANIVTLHGGGDGQSRFDVKSATLWPDGATSTASTYAYNGNTYSVDLFSSIVTNTTSVLAYGDRETAISFRDVTPLTNSDADVEAAANFLLRAAVNWMDKYREPKVSYNVGLAGLKVAVLPGDLVHLQARVWQDGRRPIDVDEVQTVMDAQLTIDSRGNPLTKIQTTNIRRWPKTVGQVIADQGTAIVQALAHPQPTRGKDTITYREAIDDDYNTTFQFFTGQEVLTIESVILRFRVDPLRSTVKTVAGSATVEMPDHQHVLQVSEDTSFATAVGLQYSGSDGFLAHLAVGAGNIKTYTNPELYESDAPATIEIDLSSAITTEYGIYDDGGGNTYAVTDLEFSVNGNTFRSDYTDVTGATGWKRLDITDECIDPDTLRPLAGLHVHTVEVQVKGGSHAGKHAQVTAQIQIRADIQSINQ